MVSSSLFHFKSVRNSAAKIQMRTSVHTSMNRVGYRSSIPEISRHSFLQYGYIVRIARYFHCKVSENMQLERESACTQRARYTHSKRAKNVCLGLRLL